MYTQSCYIETVYEQISQHQSTQGTMKNLFQKKKNYTTYEQGTLLVTSLQSKKKYRILLIAIVYLSDGEEESSRKKNYLKQAVLVTTLPLLFIFLLCRHKYPKKPFFANVHTQHCKI